MSEKLKFARLLLSGALVGVAIAGVIANGFGIVIPSADVIGAVAGGGVAAAVIKLLHLV